MKISIIGAGNVGSMVAYNLVLKQLVDDIVLVDIDKDRANAMALDISQASSLNSPCNINLSSDYDDTKDSDIVVVTAGLARRPGMSRDDLLLKNASIVSEVILNVKKHSPDALIIMVSNPLDAMVYVAMKVGNYPKNQVMGMAGVLDSARMTYFLNQKLPDNQNYDIKSTVIGGHGDSMVPLISQTSINDKALSEFLSEEDIQDVISQTRNAGKQIVEYLKTGSAYFAPALSVVEMIEAILNDSKKVLPVSSYLDGEFGYSDVVNGVLVSLGRNGIENIQEIKLNKEEQASFANSINSVNELLFTLKDKFFDK